jgi:methionyl-tRNA synthetase
MLKTCFSRAFVKFKVDCKTSESGKIIRTSKESGHVVEHVSEVNYLFKLTHFREALKDYLKANVIMPNIYRDFITLQIDDLEDLSVSRESSRISWGIQVNTLQIASGWFDNKCVFVFLFVGAQR